MRDPIGSDVFERAQDLLDRRRLVIGLCAAVVVALIAAIPGVLTSGGTTKSVHTTAAAQVTSTTDAPGDGVVNAPSQPFALAPAAPTTTTQPALVLGTTFAAPRPSGAPKVNAAAAPPPAPAPTTTSTARVCRNSYDSACGPFYWDPKPDPDQPAQMKITATPAQPKVGDTVTFKVVIDDPDDASPGYNYRSWDYGDGPATSTHNDPPPQGFCQQRYGPWTPPKAGPAGHYEEDGGYFLEHTYNTAGNYTVKFSYGPGNCYDPYNGPADGTLPITVLP